MKTEDNRVVVLIDMDCFYVQVEERENPLNKGKPACVVQYKNWKGGGIIAVNYEARAKGISRYLRGDEAKEKCPECILYRVPEQRGKADLTKYRDAGKEVLDVLCEFGVCIERASIDEAYLDVTSVVEDIFKKSSDTSITSEMLPNTHVVGPQERETDGRGVYEWLRNLSEGEFNEKSWKLAHAAALCEKMRSAVFEKTGFRCSAGISSNKMLAKLACGINKPNKQTILPPESVEEFFKTFPLKKVRHLGGKLGLILQEELTCITMGDVANLSESTLKQRFDAKTSAWLYWYARGVDLEPVSSRRLPKSIGCNKNFTGIAALDTREKILHWLEELCAEVSERLEKDKITNQRNAKLLTLTVRLDGDSRPSSYSRSIPLTPTYNHKVMAKACLTVMMKENTCKKPNIWEPVVTCIGVSASKFVEVAGGKIDRFFFGVKGKAKTPSSTNEEASFGTNVDSLDTTEVVSSTPATSKIALEEKLQESSFSDELSSDETEGPSPETEDPSPETEGPSPETEGPSPETEGYSPGTEDPPFETEEELTKLLPDAARSNVDSGRKRGFFASKTVQKFSETPSKSVPRTENNTTKLRFFANKSIRDVMETPRGSNTDAGTRASDDLRETEREEIETNPLIREIFPNLDEIDVDTVGLLPLELQREVYRIIESRKGRANEATFKRLIECEICQKQILEEEKVEHEDYHVASDLQKLSESEADIAQRTVSQSKTSKKKADKRPLEKPKGKPNIAKRSRTIESFFKSSS